MLQYTFVVRGYCYDCTFYLFFCRTKPFVLQPQEKNVNRLESRSNAKQDIRQDDDANSNVDSTKIINGVVEANHSDNALSFKTNSELIAMAQELEADLCKRIRVTE